MGLLEPHRSNLEAIEARARHEPPRKADGWRPPPPLPQAGGEAEGSGLGKALWLLLPDGGEWSGPLSARDVLQLAERQQIHPDTLVYGLQTSSGSPDSARRAAPQPLWQALGEGSLGEAARRDAEASVRRLLSSRSPA